MNRKALDLHGFEKITHYAPVYFLLIIFLVGIITPFVKLQPRPDILSLITFPLVSGVLAIIAYWWQKRVLRFRLFHTPHNSKENYDLLLQLFKKRDWIIKHSYHSQLIQGQVPGFPKSWGELVTVRFSGNDIYVNSICDPTKYPSMTAYGRNTNNILSIVKAVDGSNQSLRDFGAPSMSKPEISLVRTIGLIAWASLIGAMIWLFMK